MKKFFKLLFSRFSIVALTIILMFVVNVCLALGAIFVLELIFSYFFPGLAKYIFWTVQAVAWIIIVFTVLHIVNRNMIPETKLPWLLCVIALNLFGVAIYAVFSNNRPSKKQRRKYKRLYEHSKIFEGSTAGDEYLEGMERWADVGRALLADKGGSAVYSNTRTEYFPTGEDFFKRLLEDLEGAEKYIFLEYFIIERGVMWYTILDILKKKVQEGVEVRVLYDDIGCMGKIHMRYAQTLRKAGIKCEKFNPFVPVITNVHNNRDHRKITVIDGVIGYTGGINLADEYINVKHPFGHWKDTAVRLEGEGVKELALMFLRAYNIRSKEAEDFAPYIPERYEPFDCGGYVIPYGDGPRPLYDRYVGEEVYINVINGAKKTLYIATPYLVIDYRLRGALLSAAARGVDVRLLVPYVPDKKVVFALTRSNYMALIKGGVKIYEYTSGFVHAKSFIADGEIGIVGTINLDYRSFIHHFENAVLMYRTQAVEELEADMLKTFEISALQTEEDAKKNVVWRGVCEIAKVFAPLF